MKKVQGFTIIELMITVALLGTLAAVALPAMQIFLQNNRTAAASNELVTSISYARSTAISRSQNVVMCPSTSITATNSTCTNSTNWANGWTIGICPVGTTVTQCADGTTALALLRSYPAITQLAGNSTLTGTANNLRFQPDGIAGAAFTFTLTVPKCRDRDNRNITVSNTGRPAVSKAECT